MGSPATGVLSDARPEPSLGSSWGGGAAQHPSGNPACTLSPILGTCQLPRVLTGLGWGFQRGASLPILSISHLPFEGGTPDVKIGFAPDSDDADEPRGESRGRAKQGRGSAWERSFEASSFHAHGLAGNTSCPILMPQSHGRYITSALDPLRFKSNQVQINPNHTNGPTFTNPSQVKRYSDRWLPNWGPKKRSWLTSGFCLHSI